MSQSRASGDEPLFPEPQGLAEKRKLPSDDLPRGASIGRYLIIERLGSGGMGVVYSAYDPDLNRRVAIKLLRSQPGALASQGRARLLREAQSMARLSHPNVVAVFDVGVAFDQVFVAMEFIEGATLGEWLVRTRRTEDILRVFVDAGQGLAAAHAAGIVHRDIKPWNFPLLNLPKFLRGEFRGKAAQLIPNFFGSVNKKSSTELLGVGSKSVTSIAILRSPSII